MNWKASPQGIEIAAVSTAAVCLGGAVGFAVMRLSPLGAGLIEASVAGTLAALVGWALIGQVDRRRGLHFVSATPLDGGVTDEAVLPLDPLADDEALLLDDPLPALRDDMRVVRLFAADPVEASATAPLAGPAEMIARIEDFLGQPRGSAPPGESARGAGQAASEEASAALHVALADIRRSLRRA